MVSIETGTLNDVLAVRIMPLASPVSATIPKHIGLLFDTSGSMDGERLASLQRTTELLVAATPAHYQLSLIAFHSTADVLVEYESDKPRLLAAVAALKADGRTNLQEGLLALKDVHARHPMDAVLLLTDGEITVGVTSVRGIVSLLESALPSKPPVHTIGYGSSCNRTLLSNIALLWRSLYMFADAAEALPAVVGDVLGGIQAEVGRQATLRFPAETIECLEPATDDAAAAAGAAGAAAVAGAAGAAGAVGAVGAAGVAAGATGVYSIGTLIAAKEQWILFGVHTRSAADPTAPGGAAAGVPSMSLTYTGIDGGLIAIPIPDTQTLSSRTVACQLARVECAKGFAAIQERMTTGRLPDAFACAKALLVFLNASIATNESLVAVLKAQVSELLEQLDPALQTRAAPPSSALMSRLASNTAALTNQRGFVTRMASGGDDTHTFSSPCQADTQRSMSLQYSAGDPRADSADGPPSPGSPRRA